MLTFLLIGIALFATFLIHKTRTKNSTTIQPQQYIQSALIGVGLLICALFQPISMTLIQAGNVGIKVSLLGDDRGVGKYEYVSGLIWYNSWITRVEEIPLTQQHVEYEKQIAVTYGGLPVDLYPKFNYSVKAGSAGDMYVNLRKPLKEIEAQWLATSILAAVNDVANRWKIDSILTHREAFETDITTDANKKVGKWFVLSQLRTNLTPPPSLVESITNKTKAAQDIQVAEARKLVAVAEGITKRETAKADSAVLVIKASSESRANLLRQTSLTPMLLQQQYIEAWKAGGSQVPRVVTSGGNSAIWNMSDFIKK